MLRKGEQVVEKIIPDSERTEEWLWNNGKVKTLFDIVSKRRKTKFNPATRVRDVIKIQVADFTKDDEAQYGILEEDSLGMYKSGDKVAYIVRYATDLYGVEVFQGSDSIESYYLEDSRELVEELKRDFASKDPVKRGRPKKIEPVVVQDEEEVEIAV